MKKYDKVKRLIRGPGGEKTYILLQRYYCKTCRVYARELPDDLIPFKHYPKSIIDGVKEGSITSDILEYEDYPCEMTMKRWKNGS